METLLTEKVKNESDTLAPVVDMNLCEAHGPCVMECPFDVLDLKTISGEEYEALSFTGKLKTKLLGREKAYTARPEQCHACGICVASCPEEAIKLVRV